MQRFHLLCALLLLSPSLLWADDWPQWLGPKRDGIWRESNITRQFGEDGPPVVWRSQVAGGYAGPAVAEGRVFLTDFVTQSGDTAADPNQRNAVQGTERILCLDESTGEPLWEHSYPRAYKISYPAGPRATPLVDGNRVYMLGAEGDLLCLQVEDGTVLWQRNLRDDYQTETPMWGYAAHPLIVGNQLICLAGGDNTAVVSLDKTTGKQQWSALTTASIGYAPPTMIEAAGRKQLLIWHAKSLDSIDPSSGKLFWSEPLEPDYGMSIAPPQQSGDLLFVGGIKNKCMGLRLSDGKPGASLLWRGKNKVGVGPSHCPVALDPNAPKIIYGVDRGVLICVDLETGTRQWENYQLTTNKRPANSGTAFLTRNEDVFFIWNETAELIIARLTPQGYTELSRSRPLLERTHDAFGRGVVWSAPAFANRCIFVRNDKELVKFSLADGS